MRVWLKFARASELSYISHLDAQRAFTRLLRRAALPLAYSRGFNPHPLLSLGAPLPLGFGSEADYLDVTLAVAMPLADIAQALRGSAGGDVLRLTGLRGVPERTPALASLVRWAEYTIGLNGSIDTLHTAVSEFWAKTAVPFVKQTKRGSRSVDAKGMVHRLTHTDVGCDCVLSMGEPALLRPDELLHILADGQETWKADTIVRRELYTAQLVTPLELRLDGKG